MTEIPNAGDIISIELEPGAKEVDAQVVWVASIQTLRNGYVEKGVVMRVFVIEEGLYYGSYSIIEQERFTQACFFKEVV